MMFCLPFLVLYFYLCTYFNMLLSFVFSLLVLYAVYLCKIILECLFNVIFLKLKINYLIFYPFAYDTHLLFHPLILLYNYDGFQNSMYLNIDIHLSNNEKNKLIKQITLISKVSFILSAIFIGLILSYFTSLVLLLIMLIFPVIWGTFSYLKFTDFSYGVHYLINKYGIDVFLLQANGFKEYTPSLYFEYLDNKTMDIPSPVLLKMIENLIFIVIYHEHMLSQKETEKIVTALLDMESFFYLEPYSLQFQTRYINIVKLIAVLYHKQFEDETTFNINNILKNYRHHLINTNEYGILDHAIDRTNFFLHNYEDKKQMAHISKDIIFDLRPIFKYQKDIETTIHNYLKQ